MAALVWWFLSVAGSAGAGGVLQRQGLDLVKIAVTLTGGVGGVVVLVVAYRKQRLGEVAERREAAASRRDELKLFTERYVKAAEQLGNAAATVRLVGVHAMADLADEWAERRQTCVNVLCGHVRMYFDPEPPGDPAELRMWRGERQVRGTVFRVVAERLRDDAPVSWQGCDFDFTGAVIDGADFHSIVVSEGTVSFERAVFPSGLVDFDGAVLSGGVVDFSRAVVSGGEIRLGCVKLEGSVLHFHEMDLCGGQLAFDFARLSAGCVNLDDINARDGRLSFYCTEVSGANVSFSGSEFSGAEVSFRGAKFLSGNLAFGDCVLARGTVCFDEAKFAGGYVGVHRSRHEGGVFDFSNPGSWDRPPVFTSTRREQAVEGVRLPGTALTSTTPA